MLRLLKVQRLLSFIALLGILSLNTALAQIVAVPNSMSFQGRLAKPNGTPVPDGTYSICFRLYDALTGGNVKFEKTVSAVSVKNGVFAVQLTGFAADTFQSNLWLGIQIGTDAELTPRQPLVSVPYAFKADYVRDGSITGASLADESNHRREVRREPPQPLDMAPQRQCWSDERLSRHNRRPAS